MPHVEHKDGWPSVTTIQGIVAKPFLYRWYGTKGWDECERIKREAGEFGSHVHDAIEKILRNEPLPELSDREAQLVDTFTQWRNQSGFTPVAIELHVESAAHKYHGTFDAIGHFGDPAQPFVLDWKTSSAIDDSYGAQLAAYAQAYKEMTGTEITVGGVVRLEKKPEKSPQIEVRQFDNLPKYFEVFLACKQVWDFTNSKGAWVKETKSKRGRKAA
jgi:hypothetical protein